MKKEWLNLELKDLKINATKINTCSECGCDLDSPTAANLTAEEVLWWPHRPGCSKPNNKRVSPGTGPLSLPKQGLEVTPIS